MRSEADIIYNHIKPMQEVDIQPIPISFADVFSRYVEFAQRDDFTTKDKYKMMAKLYAREMKYREMELGLSYRMWSEETLYKFESEFAEKILRKCNII